MRFARVVSSGAWGRRAGEGDNEAEGEGKDANAESEKWEAKVAARRQRQQRRMEMRFEGEHAKADAESDESDQECVLPRPSERRNDPDSRAMILFHALMLVCALARVLRSRREELEHSQASAEEFTYFHAHEQGKSAVRLLPGRPELPLPSPGIHGFGSIRSDDTRLYRCAGERCFPQLSRWRTPPLSGQSHRHIALVDCLCCRPHRPSTPSHPKFPI